MYKKTDANRGYVADGGWQGENYGLGIAGYGGVLGV